MFSFDSYLAAIRRDAALLSQAAQRGLDVAVLSCPGWDVADLVEHTGVAHRHKIQILNERWLEGAPDPVAVPPRQELLEWFDQGAAELVDVLRSHDSAEPISTWDENNETVGFWYRRMAHETFIHRIDAEQAHGISPRLDIELALDGIDELLASFIGGAPPWASVTRTDQVVVLSPSDGDERWNVRLAEFSGTSPATGTVYQQELLTIVEPDVVMTDRSAVVHGTAGDIDMWLWGRAPIDQLDIRGHMGAAEALRSVAAETTS